MDSKSKEPLYHYDAVFIEHKATGLLVTIYFFTRKKQKVSSMNQPA